MEPRTHHLKTINPFFNRVACGYKTAELRYDDRGYSVSDLLVLQEYNAISKEYSGRKICVQVTDIVTGDDFEGLKLNWSMLSFKEIDRNF